MNAEAGRENAIARIAAAIGEPARSRMLCSLLDGHARTSTELAMVAEVSPSTASVHLNRLKADKLVLLRAQGRHRYYCLATAQVARALESLLVLAGGKRAIFQPNTPDRLRTARSCYDHMAGVLAVQLHDRIRALRWIEANPAAGANGYEVTAEGAKQFSRLGVDLQTARAQRRRFAYACLDWSERRPHLAGALGAELMKLALRRRWIDQDLDSRALALTRWGQRELRSRFSLEI